VRTSLRPALIVAGFMVSVAGAWGITTLASAAPASDHVNHPTTTITFVRISDVGLIPPATAMATTGLIPPACADHTGPIDCGGTA